jgi:putative inorganic carbon (hco3(-)) transporter
MRDVVLTAMLVAGIIAAIRRPWLGVILWAWVSLMTPHRLTWGFAYSLPWAQLSVFATFLGMILHWREVKMYWRAPVVLLVVFTLWQCITYQFSFYPDWSYDIWTKVLKINFMILVTIALLHTRQHVEALVWTIVASLGFYGVKGGIFTILSGGAHLVFGPASSFIEGNNELALAIIMVIPLMYYLRHVSRNKLVRHGLVAAMLLSVFAALGTHSRGGLLAMAAMVTFLWFKSPSKLPLGLAIVAAGVLILPFMPEQWWTRMSTIDSFEQDGSAMGRINAWWVTWNVANAHFFGGGYQMYSPQIFARYAPNPLDVHVAHSIYFSALGEHGFVGLALFLWFWIATWREAGWTRRDPHVRKAPEYEWARMLSRMVQVSAMGYLVGGAFASLTYYDLPYYLMAILVIMRHAITAERPVSAASHVPPIGRQPAIARVTGSS